MKASTATGPSVWAKTPKMACPHCGRVVGVINGQPVPHNIPGPGKRGPCLKTADRLPPAPPMWLRRPKAPPPVPHYELPVKPPRPTVVRRKTVTAHEVTIETTVETDPKRVRLILLRELAEKRGRR